MTYFFPGREFSPISVHKPVPLTERLSLASQSILPVQAGGSALERPRERTSFLGGSVCLCAGGSGARPGADVRCISPERPRSSFLSL